MIEFFQSFSIYNYAALFGLLSILAPIIIHIINPSRGRIVFIGKIEFIKQVNKLKVTELKLTQWLLLIIRISLLALLTLLIVGLYKKSNPKTFGYSHVYLSTEWLNNSNENDINKLLKEHIEDDVFLLNDNFELISAHGKHSLTKLTAYKEKIKNITSLKQSSLIEELETNNLQPKKTFLYLTNILNDYSDKKAVYSKDYQWRIKKIEPELIKSTPIAIDVFYDETRLTDVSYLTSAFDYINQNIQLLNLNYHQSPEEILTISNDKQWIFWLTDTEVSDKILESIIAGNYLLTDVKSSTRLKSIKASLVPLNGELFAFYDRQQARRIDLESDIIWGNASGSSLLTSKKQGHGKIYQYSSRFHHDWTSLIESSSFPSILNKLLVQVVEDSNQKLVSVSEITNTKYDLSQIPEHKQPLYRWLILFISILWLLERWLADHKIVNTRANSNE